MAQVFAHVSSCSRCPAVEHTEVTLEEIREMSAPGEVVPVLKIVVDGTDTVEFETLCGACTDIVLKYISAIGKHSEKKSSLRKAKDEDV